MAVKLLKWKMDAERLLPEFVHYLISHRSFRARLTSQATGTSGSMLNISKSKLEELKSPFPAIEVQERFRNLFWCVRETVGQQNRAGPVPPAEGDRPPQVLGVDRSDHLGAHVVGVLADPLWVVALTRAGS